MGMAEGQQLEVASVLEGMAQLLGAASALEGMVLLPPQAAYPQQWEVHLDTEDLECRQAAQQGTVPAQKGKIIKLVQPGLLDRINHSSMHKGNQLVILT